METFNNKMENVPDFVAKIVDKIVAESKVLKEMPKNRLSVGSDGVPFVKSLYWQPHHLRLYFSFDKTFFNVSEPTFKFGCRVINGSELEIPNFMEHRIVIKKFQIELGNKIDHKRFYPIVLDSTAKAQVLDITRKKVMESINVLREFIRRFGGVSDFKLLNFRHQDKIASEDVIDTLPLKLQYKALLTEKDYNEQNIETNEPMGAINYIENAALRSVTPLIASRLDIVDRRIVDFEDRALVPLTEQIRLHLSVLSDMKDTLRNINTQMIGGFGSVSSIKNSPFSRQSEFVEGDSLPETPEVSMVAVPSTINRFDSRGVKALKLARWL